MKKITMLFLAIFTSLAMVAQNDDNNKGSSGSHHQLSIGLVGVNYEIPVGANMTIAPGAWTNLDLSRLSVGVSFNYYFNSLFGLPHEWDVYAGANGGYAVINNSTTYTNDLDLGLQVGGRWFWSPKWGLVLQLGGGTGGGNTFLGVTMRM